MTTMGKAAVNSEGRGGELSGTSGGCGYSFSFSVSVSFGFRLSFAF